MSNFLCSLLELIKLFGIVTAEHIQLKPNTRLLCYLRV